ncbi:MAG TPA: transcription elongation factor GreA [Candidatus Saccharimonadales bacterium]|nr:transcription elongation factor GreA [Candidatus Saccharimonadales bacterium]
MLKKTFRLTKDGVAELQRELESLQSERTVIAERIRSARELGDLAENAEYQSARQDQDKTEARITEIEHIMQNLEIIESPRQDDKVELGSKVQLKSADGKTKSFQVVGTLEANPLEGKISDESPIGKSLLGKRMGAEVEIKTPTETAVYKIVSIA